MSDGGGREVDCVVLDEHGEAAEAAQAREFFARHADRTVRTILILVAMEAEAAPLVDALGLARDAPPAVPPPAPCVTYSGTLAPAPPPAGGAKAAEAARIHLCCFGKCAHTGVDNIGTVAAGLMTYLAVQATSPDLVVSAGTAGGFAARGAAIADVFVSTATVNHDRRIALPGFDAYGVGRAPAPPTPRLRAALKGRLKPGVVSSGNSLDCCAEDLAALTHHAAAVKEMEAAAVAWAASLHGAPVLCLKAVTDVVDGGRPAAEEFVENLGRAAAALQAVVPAALAFIAGRRLSEL